MMVIRKVQPRVYEAVYVFKDGTEIMKSKLFPSSANRKQYDALTFGNWCRFRTIKEWKEWVTQVYGGEQK